MTELPPPPPGGDAETITNEQPEKRGSFVRVYLAVVVFILVAFGVTTWLTAEEPTPVATPSPTSLPDGVISAPVITQEILQAKNDRAAFYIGRGEVEGANQVMRDLITVNRCQVINAYYVPVSSEEVATDKANEYRSKANSTYPEALVAVSVAPTEGEMKARGEYVAVGIVIQCP